MEQNEKSFIISARLGTTVQFPKKKLQTFLSKTTIPHSPWLLNTCSYSHRHLCKKILFLQVVKQCSIYMYIYIIFCLLGQFDCWSCWMTLFVSWFHNLNLWAEPWMCLKLRPGVLYIAYSRSEKQHPITQTSIQSSMQVCFYIVSTSLSVKKKWK